MNWLLFKNSLLTGLCTTTIATALGLGAALFASASGPRWRAVVLGGAAGTLALPAFLVVNAWLQFFGAGGRWEACLPFPLFSPAGAVTLLSLLFWPVTAFAAVSALRRTPPGLVESDLAVRGWRLCQGVLWPRVRGAVLCGAAVTFVLSLNQFAVPAILQVKVLPTEAWVRFNTHFDAMGAFVAGWPLLAGAALALIFLQRREVPWPGMATGIPGSLLRAQVGGAIFFGAGILTLLTLLLSLGLPLAHLLLTTRTWTDWGTVVAGSKSAMAHTLWYSGGTATLVLLLGFIAAAGGWLGKRGRTVRWALWMTFLAPGILLGIALVQLLNHRWLAFISETSGVVLLALCIRYLVVGVMPLRHAMAQVGPHLEGTARLEGVGWVGRIRHVFWPTAAPAAAAAWYVVFLLCLWDVETILLVYPPGGETLAVKVFNLLHYGHTTHVNTLCLVLLALAVAPLAVYPVWKRLWGKGAAGILAVALMALTGCGGGESPTSAALSSRFFTHAEVVGTRGAGVGQLNKPRSLATDAEGNVYAVDMTGRVQKFSASGVFLRLWQMPETDLGKPKGMDRDAEGNMVVIEPHYQRVNYFDVNGGLIRQWGKRGTNDGEFTLPRDAAVNASGDIYVSEYGQMERVQRFSAAGEFRGSFGRAGTGPGEFNRPEGLCVDRQGRVYVADSCNHRVQVFSAAGEFLYTYGKAGSGKGELSYPYDLCVDAAGYQFVCEFGNSRVQVFDAKGEPVEVIGGPGKCPGQFANPWSVALDDAGNLYVADSLNHRLQKLARSRPNVAGVAR